MKNYYFESIPITSERQAIVLASPSSWEIINELRHEGVKGLTVEELSDKLDIPKSTIYHVLKELRAAGFVETRRSLKKIGRPSKEMEEEEKRTGKQKKIYVENIPWGMWSFDHDFDRFATEYLDGIIDESNIFEHYIQLIDEIVENMKEDSYLKQFLPSDQICYICKKNHQAEEFVRALVSLISDRIMENHEFMMHVNEKHKMIVHS